MTSSLCRDIWPDSDDGNIQPLVGGLVGRPLDLTAATASSSFSSLSPPPSLLCSLLTVAATVPERPRPAPEDKRRQQMEKPPKLLISLANLWTRQVFLDFRHHHHSLLITSQPSHCSYRIVSKRQKPPWPKKKLSDIFVRLNWDIWKSSLVYLFVCLFVCGALGTGRQAEQWIDGTRCPPHPPPLPTCPPPLQAPHDHRPHDQWPTTRLHTRRLQNWPISAAPILVIIWPMLTNNGWSLGHTVMTIGMVSQALSSVGLLIFKLYYRAAR